MHVLVSCKFEKDLIKTTEKRWKHRFRHYKSMGAFCRHGNQSIDPICSKTLYSLSSTPMMLHIKFEQDWPTGLRGIQEVYSSKSSTHFLVTFFGSFFIISFITNVVCMFIQKTKKIRILKFWSTVVYILNVN